MRQISIIFLLITFHSFTQELPRRAMWEASFDRSGLEVGIKVLSVNEGSPLHLAGIKPNDLLLQVNQQIIASNENWTSATYAIRSEVETRLMLRRDDAVFIKNVQLNELPREIHNGLDVLYESVTSDLGIIQRTIITKPEQLNGKLPAIILLQGLSCSTIETYTNRGGNWAQQISDVVEKSGMVVMRVDKPGVGDSQGDCACTDFHTELEGYRAAIRSLKSKSYVDTSKIVVYGSSMGSALAPLLANEFNLAGVISDGTFFKTWFEHMLEIERRILQMQGNSESEITRKMNEAYIPLYYGMLIEKKTYQEVINEQPSLASYNYHGPAHMYGRPVSYYHQLQDLDLAGEWSKLEVPVRILYGTNDWIMSEFDNQMIIDLLERVGHEDHELRLYDGLDHWNTIHESPDNSFHGKQGKWDPRVPELIIGWVREMIK